MKMKLSVVVMLAGAVAYGDGSVVTNGSEVVIEATSGTFTVTDAYGPEITKVTKAGAATLEYVPTSPSTYGQLVVEAGQLRVKSADALGAGDVSLKYSSVGTSLMVPEVDLTIANKVRFGTEATVAAFSTAGRNPVLTLQSIGSLNDAHKRNVRVGRGNGGATRICLQLTQPNSEAIDALQVKGTTSVLFDGGTVKMAREAASPFVADLDPAYPKTYAVTPAGVTLEAQEGADVALGVAPTYRFAPVTNVVETYEPTNNSFESGATDWSYTHPTYSSEYSGVKENGSGFDTDGATAYTTTHGSNYYHLRRASTLTRSLTIPTDGLWRVTYENGSRPAEYYSTGIATTVKVDQVTVHVDPAITFAQKHPFRRVEASPVFLTAGEHTLSLTTGDNKIGGGGINLDWFVLERVTIDEVSQGLTKTGAGRLALTALTANVPVTASAGDLVFEGATLSSNAVTVSTGATLTLRSANLAAGASVSVAAGGTLALSDATGNAVANGSFEADKLKGSDMQRSAPTGWSGADTGVQRNGGEVSGDGPTTPYGLNTAVLRKDTALTQTLAGLPAGDYRVTFVQSYRKDTATATFQSHKLQTVLKIDGNAVVTAGPLETPDYDYTRVAAFVNIASSGDHVLKLETTGNTSVAGAMVFVDDVRVERVTGFAEVTEGEIRMVSGSTLRLDNCEPISVRRFLVDGVPVNGNRSALRRAGISVIGEGAIKVGNSAGMVLIFR